MSNYLRKIYSMLKKLVKKYLPNLENKIHTYFQLTFKKSSQKFQKIRIGKQAIRIRRQRRRRSPGDRLTHVTRRGAPRGLRLSTKKIAIKI